MKIFYQRSYSIGPYLTERIGFEMDAPDECDPLDELETLKQYCDDAHKKLNPGLEVEVNYSAIPGHPQSLGEMADIQPPKKDPKQSAQEKMIQAINECTSVKVLETFKLLVKNNPEFQKAYEEKLKSLQ